MAKRLSVITTRTGDRGTTGLGDGSRIDKDAPRIAALGDVDELNSALGVLRAEALSADIDSVLARVQNDLFDLGAELCIPGHIAVTEQQVLFLEQTLEYYNARLTSLQEFILPGGTRAAALAHMARTICRRAERSVVTMNRLETAHAHAHQTESHTSTPTVAVVNQFAQRYLNRLSDVCFVLARELNRIAAQPDVLWQR